MAEIWQALLELADDHLVLGHRLSEWCGHAPMLEEDLALANLGLDCLGTARTLYARVGELEGAGRSEDDLAYLRDARDWRNCLLVEQEGDFALTMLRQLHFAAVMHPYWEAALEIGDETVRGVAGKAVKEMRYHIRHAGEWVVRMGDGTEESARRMRDAVERLAPLVPELFEASEAARAAEAAGVLPERGAMREAHDAVLAEAFAEAGLEAPEVPFPRSGGRAGRHGEALGHMLAVMQSVHRQHPGATW